MALTFLDVIAGLSLIMLVVACIEVGSNDAANLVNAVFGARVMRRKRAVAIAGAFVILGATFSSPVLDTVRKGIFDLGLFDAQSAASVFLAAYFVNTSLLYGYSAFGMPVSTTASLVFSLAGGAVGATLSFDAVNTDTLLKVITAIFLSILLSGFTGFMVQRIFRAAIGRDCQRHHLVLLHGPWMAGLVFSALCWFMVSKGLSGVLVRLGEATMLDRLVEDDVLGGLGVPVLALLLWFTCSFLVQIVLASTGRRGTRYLFHATAISGMACMAFAFGQNDLANCASPGIAIAMIWQEGLKAGSSMDVPLWLLSLCGFFIFIGMRTKRAQRVTRAEVNTGSQHGRVKLYAPQWCRRVARRLIGEQPELPVEKDIGKPRKDERGKKVHYDPLRASVILLVSATVIAFASGLGLPVSTTYVAFAAVVATGWGDRVFVDGSSDLKLGRAIWVVTGWLIGAAVAVVVSAVVAAVIYQLQMVGIALMLVLSGVLRYYFGKIAEEHERLYHT